MPILSEWQSFYVIVGSSAGALIGLQFVVITLLANVPRMRDEARGGAAFATPTVVHFAVVLLLAAIISAPWRQIVPMAIFYGLAGLLGVVYTIRVARAMRHQTAYKPETEDWLFYAILPGAAYALLAAAGGFLFFAQRLALFGVAAATLSLLLTAIHNAWDAVTYHVLASRK